MKLRQLFEARAKRTVAVMPGGFHPFHPGHKSLYDWAVKTFGKANVYVAASDNQDTRPFPFDVKKKLAAMAGVPESNFIQVKSPFLAREYSDLLDDNTALVFVRSEKDKTSHPLPDQVRKSDGKMGYLLSYKDGDLETSDTHGYLVYGPTIDFDFSGMSIKSASELRAAWPDMSEEDKLQAADLMYPGNGDSASKLLDTALGTKETEPVEEWVGPALKGGKYAFQIAKFFWNNKWAIGALTVTWKTLDWIGDAIAFVRKYTDNPIVQGMMRYGLPAVAVAVALYGGKKLYDELVKAENEEDVKNVLKDFQPDMSELEKLEAELRDMVNNKETNEIMSFGIRRSPKRATIKKKRPPEEDSIQDKIKKRRALASKVGVKKAFSSDALDEASPITDLKKIITSKIYKKEYLMALKMMKQEAISAADAARRFMHVDARTLDTMANKMDI